MSLQSASISTCTLSKDELTSIISQIESELYCSKVYRTALGMFKQRLGEAAESSLLLLNAVAREAMRLAIEQVATKYPDLSSIKPEKSGSADTTVESSAFGHAQQMYVLEDGIPSYTASYDADLGNEAIARSSYSSPTPESDRSDLHSDYSDTEALNSENFPPQSSKKPTKRKRKGMNSREQAEVAAQQWATAVRQVGREIQKARETRSLSLEELHKQTLVPLHHLRALESGIVERLPEKVYVRSFIHKIADVLSLDGTQMAASLPMSPTVQTVVPSWYRPPSTPTLGISLSPIHLYLGYTVLMAGAIGGLAWMSEQSPPGAVAEPDPTLTSPCSLSPQSAVPTHVPGLTSRQNGFSVGPDIAPPEALSC